MNPPKTPTIKTKCPESWLEGYRKGLATRDAEVLKEKKLAEQCCRFKFIECSNTNCLNWICPLNNNDNIAFLKGEIK